VKKGLYSKSKGTQESPTDQHAKNQQKRKKDGPVDVNEEVRETGKNTL